MPKMMNTLVATTLILGGCTAGEKVESVPSPSASPVFRPIEKHDAVVRFDADEHGNYIGVRTYPQPWTDNSTGSYQHNQIGKALCQQEARPVHDENVPKGAPYVDTSTWLRFEDGRWSPKPYYDLGGAVLGQCADFGLEWPEPR